MTKFHTQICGVLLYYNLCAVGPQLASQGQIIVAADDSTVFFATGQADEAIGFPISLVSVETKTGRVLWQFKYSHNLK